MSKAKIKTKDFMLQTARGNVSVQSVKLPDGSSQLNVFMPPGGGAGLFAWFEPGAPKHLQAESVRKLIEAGPHQPHQNLCEYAPGCMVAGSGGPVELNLGSRGAIFGVPEVAHAN